MRGEDWNFLYSIEVQIGTPPQSSLFLVDQFSPFNFVFLKGGKYANMTPDAFFDIKKSETSSLVSAAPVSPYVTNGITLNGPTYMDYMCLDNSTSI